MRLHRCYTWVGMDDLQSYAYLGLAKAASYYQPDRGIPFPIFARRKGAFLAIDEMRKDGVVTRRGSRAQPQTSGDAALDYPDPHSQSDAHRLELKDFCRSMLKKLSSSDRQLISLYYADELTFREIANVFHISESAVCLRHKAVLLRLRRLAGAGRVA